MKTNRKATINKTSIDNYYDVLSSDGYTHYPMLFTAPGACVCHCPAGAKGMPCYHRNCALETIEYIPVVEDSIDDLIMARIRRRENEYWSRVEDKAEGEWERDAVRNLWDNGPEAA